ncbi:hypothetical protein BDF22DRAFT_740455 [Syncephalis plumigaleata]|nr:hypothetical protein BDF22DRAFT_740455 [Syncephalis plumigaleata]
MEKREFDTNLYELLEITENATADDIKRAYRRLALRCHPDKQSISANEEERANATRQFQRVGLAYAVLGDEKRRARYDRTGANWNEYFKELFNQVDDAALTKFAAEYRGSQEEKTDLLTAYNKCKGNFDEIYDEMHVVNVLDDEDRLQDIIRAAIDAGEVEGYPAFTKEPAKAAEALHAKLKDRNDANASNVQSENDLALMLQTRHASRMTSLIANLEAKYAPQSAATTAKSNKKKKDKGTTKKRQGSEEPMDTDESTRPKRRSKKKATPAEPSEEDSWLYKQNYSVKNNE